MVSEVKYIAVERAWWNRAAHIMEARKQREGELC
jgi:hypothetical protein